jgi:hypothetical protein
MRDSRYKKRGDYFEAGVGKKHTKQEIQDDVNTIADKGILNDIEAVFKEQEELIIKSLKTEGNIQLCYGMIPTFRDWFSPELDEQYMYHLSPDGQEQVNWIFEEMINRLGNKGIIVMGDEGDGTVMWAMTQEYYEKHYDEDGNMKDEESGIKKSNFKIGDKVVLIEDHLNASGHMSKKGEQGVITYKQWSAGMREWAYDIDTGVSLWIPLKVPEYSLKKVESGIRKKSDWEKGGNIGNWERIIFDETSYYIKFKNQEDDRILLIEGIEKDSMQRYNPPKWQVSVGGSISRVLIKDYAKSKAEALKVAKTYMRSH